MVCKRECGELWIVEGMRKYQPDRAFSDIAFARVRRPVCEPVIRPVIRPVSRLVRGPVNTKITAINQG